MVALGVGILVLCEKGEGRREKEKGRGILGWRMADEGWRVREYVGGGDFRDCDLFSLMPEKGALFSDILHNGSGVLLLGIRTP